MLNYSVAELRVISQYCGKITKIKSNKGGRGDKSTRYMRNKGV